MKDLESKLQKRRETVTKALRTDKFRGGGYLTELRKDITELRELVLSGKKISINDDLVRNVAQGWYKKLQGELEIEEKRKRKEAKAAKSESTHPYIKRPKLAEITDTTTPNLPSGMVQVPVSELLALEGYAMAIQAFVNRHRGY